MVDGLRNRSLLFRTFNNSSQQIKFGLTADTGSDYTRVTSHSDARGTVPARTTMAYNSFCERLCPAMTIHIPN